MMGMSYPKRYRKTGRAGFALIVGLLALVSMASTQLPAEFSQGVMIAGKKWAILAPQQLAGAQEAIDGAFHRIFSTPTGAGWLREVFLCSSELLTEHLGVSRKAAAQLTTDCSAGSKAASLAGSGYRSRLSPKPRTYGFVVLDPDVNGEFDSYTYPTNSTLILLHDRKISDIDILPVLVHELAVYLDQKFIIDPYWDLFTNRERVTLSLGASTAKRNQHALRVIYDALGNPVLQLAFSSLRAFAVENAVLRELGRPETHSLDSQNCLSHVWSVVNTLQPSWTSLWALSMRVRWNSGEISVGFSDLPAPSKDKMDAGSRQQSLEDAISDQIEKDMKTVASGLAEEDGKVEDLCSFLVRPNLGRGNSRVSFGPRPRIGPW